MNGRPHINFGRPLKDICQQLMSISRPQLQLNIGELQAAGTVDSTEYLVDRSIDDFQHPAIDEEKAKVIKLTGRPHVAIGRPFKHISPMYEASGRQQIDADLNDQHRSTAHLVRSTDHFRT